MDDHCKSLAFQFDLFLNNVLNLLDTTTERDYLKKLKLMEELSSRINESKDDKKTIKSSLEKIQDECSKLHFQLKTSARLLDEVQAGKEKLEIENESLKYQLDQFYNVFKKPDTADKIQTRHSNRSDCLKQDEKKTLNNTDALLSDLSYSVSEDSSYEIKKVKHDSDPVEKFSAKNNPNMFSKPCQVENYNTNGRQIIATTTLTMDLGCANFKSLNMDLNGVNVKSVTNTHPIPSSKSLLSSSSSDSEESLSSGEPEKEFTPTISNIDKNNEKKHNFVQKFVVLPEICSQCHKKIKFNNCMVKCEECKIIAHSECKDLVPDLCSFDQNQIYALNFDIPPLIVHCISEIEKRGLDTVGLYRVSGSDKEVKILRDKFRKGVPNLNDVDIHVLCGCLKYFIRTQKNHLISQNDFLKMANALTKDNKVSELFHQSVLEISSTNRKILAFLILHLKKVAGSPKCRMDYRCLAIVFGPTIVGVSSTSLIELHNESEIINNVVIELLKLTESFWYSLVKTDSTSSDELLHSTPTRSKSQTPKTAQRFFSSGKKKRILDSPTQNRAAKQVKYKKLN